jgi:hypothetical protein
MSRQSGCVAWRSSNARAMVDKIRPGRGHVNVEPRPERRPQSSSVDSDLSHSILTHARVASPRARSTDRAL